MAGRIQQIQLLVASRDQDQSLASNKEEQDRLWTQLEAEIHLHRHKVVTTACRAKCLDNELPSPGNHSHNKNGIGPVRVVRVNKSADEGLGISITGGKEHGVPIIISQIHQNTPAHRCGQLYVGDAILKVNDISLENARHLEAAEILLNQVSN